MAYIKQILDQSNNEILPITNTTAVLNPDGLSTLEGRLQQIESDIDDKQDLLISGVNIKTIDGLSVLGAGDLDVRGDWNEDTGSDPGFIYNRPPIRTGTGLNSIIEESLSGVGANLAIGNYSHAEGVGSIAYGMRSHAEGFGGASLNYQSAPFTITADSADAEYYEIDTTDGAYAGMLLYYNGTYGQVYDIEEYESVYYISMEPGQTLNPDGPVTGATVYIVPGAIGLTSHTEGEQCEAIGQGSHAEGNHTVALNKYEHSQGQYNVSNRTNTSFGNPGNTLFSIGMGIEKLKAANAFEVMQNGDAYLINVNRYDGANATTQTAGTVQDAINRSLCNVTTQQDGSIVFVNNVGDTITVDLTHSHPGTIETDVNLMVMSGYGGSGGSREFVVEKEIPSSWCGSGTYAYNYLDLNFHCTIENKDSTTPANVECFIELGHYEVPQGDSVAQWVADRLICSTETWLPQGQKVGDTLKAIGNISMTGGYYIGYSTKIRTSFVSTCNIVLYDTTPLSSKTSASQILARVYKNVSIPVN